MSSRPSRGAARLAAILDALPDALVLVNTNGTVVAANTIALEAFESPGTSLVGRGLLDLLPEFDPKRIPGSMRRPEDEPEQGPRTKPTRMTARRTDGSELPVEVTSANLEDGESPFGDGQHYTGDELLMLVVRDLTGTLDTEAELARQRRQTEMILRAAAEGVVGTDTDGRIVLVNPSAAQILGYRAGDLGGQELHPLIHHSRPDGSALPYAETPLADTLRSGRKHRVRGQVLWSKDGRAVPVDLTTAPVRDGDQLVGAVLAFTDRRAYDGLKARREQLSAVLGEALRGPLEQLRGELGALAADPAGQLWPEANQILHHLSAGYGRMTTLIDSVLDFQRVDAGRERLRVRTTSVEGVVNDAVERAVELIGPGRAQFVVHAPPGVEAEVDAERLAQAVAHLVADVAGVDATGRAAVGLSGDSTIVVAAAQRGDVVRVEVRGPHNGGNPVHEPLARGVARLHGGILQTHEVPGQHGGTAYVLEVPLAGPGPSAASSGAARQRDRSNETTVMPEPAAPRRGMAAGAAGGAAVPAEPAGGATGASASGTADGTVPPAGLPAASEESGPVVGEATPAGPVEQPTPTGRRARRPLSTDSAERELPATPAVPAPAGPPEPSLGGADRPTGRRRRARQAEPDTGDVPVPPEGGGRRRRRSGTDAFLADGDTPSAGTEISAGSGRRRARPADGGPEPSSSEGAGPPPADDAAARSGTSMPVHAHSTDQTEDGSATPPQPGRRRKPADEGAAAGTGTPAQGAPVPGAPVPGAPGVLDTPVPGTPAHGTAAHGTAAQGTPAQGTPAPGGGRRRRPVGEGPVARHETHGESGDHEIRLPDPGPQPVAGHDSGDYQLGQQPDPHDSGHHQVPRQSGPRDPDLHPAGPRDSDLHPAGPHDSGEHQLGQPAVHDSGEHQTGQATPVRNGTGRRRARRPLATDTAGREAAAADETPQPVPVEPADAAPHQPLALEPLSAADAEPADAPPADAAPAAPEAEAEPAARQPQPAPQPDADADPGTPGGATRFARSVPRPAPPAMAQAQPGSISVRTLGQGMAFTEQIAGRPGDPRTPAADPRTPADPRAAAADPRSAAADPRTAAADPRTPTGATTTGPAHRRKLGTPPHGTQTEERGNESTAGRTYAIGAPDAAADEGPEPLDTSHGVVETDDDTAFPMDDELPPEPLDNPRRLLVWPEPDSDTSAALTDRGYRPVIVRSREEVDAQIAAYPAALFVDPLTGPITRTALQSLRTAAVAAEIPVLVTAGLGQATREAAYGADPAVLLKALAPRDSGQHPPRVLLFEENADIAGALSTALERRGMQVGHAADDETAVALATQMRPNLVVMDLMQVRRRRAGIVDWLSANGLLNRMPMVVYTAVDIDPGQLPRLRSGETVLFLAERSTSTEVQGRIVDLLAKIGAT